MFFQISDFWTWSWEEEECRSILCMVQNFSKRWSPEGIVKSSRGISQNWENGQQNASMKESENGCMLGQEIKTSHICWWILNCDRSGERSWHAGGQLTKCYNVQRCIFCQIQIHHLCLSAIFCCISHPLGTASIPSVHMGSYGPQIMTSAVASFWCLRNGVIEMHSCVFIPRSKRVCLFFTYMN